MGQARLGGFRGILQVDGYAGYQPLAEKGAVRLALHWAHMRSRRFYELAAAGNALIADETLKRIAEIYHVETSIRGTPADKRRAARDLTSRPRAAVRAAEGVQQALCR